MSELMRDALSKQSGQASDRQANERSFHGFRPIPRGGAVVTNKLVNDLRDELGI